MSKKPCAIVTPYETLYFKFPDGTLVSLVTETVVELSQSLKALIMGLRICPDTQLPPGARLFVGREELDPKAKDNLVKARNAELRLVTADGTSYTLFSVVGVLPSGTWLTDNLNLDDVNASPGDTLAIIRYWSVAASEGRLEPDPPFGFERGRG